MEGKKSKCGRKALLGVILFTVLVSLAVGLGLALGGTSSGSFQPTIVENCKYDVYGLSEECESKGSIEAVPHCIHERYVALETELHLPRTSPTGDCTPSRLALLSMSYTNQRAYTATYVLSTLFYTTGGSLWKRKEGWLTSESVCAWEGVKCKVVCYDSGAGSQTCQLDPGELRELNLEDNALKGLLPIELGLLVTMERLNLKSNALSGTIPESLSSMNSLTTLDLSLNADMGGIIPDTISKLSRLREFLMEGLQVSGSLPTQVGGMTSLERLVLSRNRISGALPSEIGKLANLEDLMIDENDLTGSIPTQLGGCTHLTSLILYQNTLTGTLPVELGRLTKLCK
jgi:Leucine-rich repeat (LRR) protein